MSDLRKTENGKLPLRSTIAYSIGSSGANVSFYMINNYLMLFYTDIVTLSAAAISAIMLIARIWDAVNDPMMGMVEDRTRTRWGKFRPWLMIGPPFLAIFNLLTFTAFPLTGATKAIVCGICYIFAGMAYTVVQVAINGLVNRITNDPQAKMNVIAIAQIANQIGQVIIAAVLMPIILHFSAGHEVADGHGYFMGTLFVCLVTVPMIWYAAWRCREVSVDEPATVEKKEKKPLGESLKLVAKNDQLVFSVLSTFLACVGIIGRYAVLSYYVIYVVGSYTLISPVFAVMSFAQMIGNMPLPWLTKKFGKIKVYVVANFLSAAVLVLLFFLSKAPNNAVIIAMSAIIGFLGASGSISYSFTCDSVEYGDWKYGIRDDGLAFSIMSFGVKLSQALTGALAAPLLVAMGYVANQAQAPSTVNGINALVNIAPAVILVIAMVPILLKYRLDEPTMAKITAELTERRAAAAQAE
ncbi:MAG: MFS transporter [Oscillospiraceae bacterium]|nr:MFS transporter [Oscillospiraceae bacterium]